MRSHCFGYLSCLLSLGAVELFPGVNRNDKNKTSHNWIEMYSYYFSNPRAKKQKTKKFKTTAKKKKNEMKQMAAALLLLLSLKQVVMLFPSLSVNISADRHFTIGRVLFFSVSIPPRFFCFLWLWIFFFLSFIVVVVVVSLRLLLPLILTLFLEFFLSQTCSSVLSDARVLIESISRWTPVSIKSFAAPCPSVRCLFDL